jgi:hypothetical protein
MAQLAEHLQLVHAVLDPNIGFACVFLVRVSVCGEFAPPPKPVITVARAAALDCTGTCVRHRTEAASDAR